MKHTHTSTLKKFLSLGLAIVMVAGCGGGGGGSSSVTTSTATVLLSGPSAGGTGAPVRTPVKDSDVVSLLLTVTKVELQRCDGSAQDDGIWTVDVNQDNFDPDSISIRPGGTVQWTWTADGEHTITGGDSGVADEENPFEESGSIAGDVVEIIFEGEAGDSFPYFSNTEADIEAGMAGVVNLDDDAVDDGDSGGGHVVVFEGAEEFDVVMPDGLSEILTSANVPSGRYCKIRLSVESPRLLLKEDEPFDPENPPYRENVQLTANGRLFIGKHFELTPGGEVLIRVAFEALHLVESGASGKYVLTPQMRAGIDIEEAEIEQSASFVSADCEAGILTVLTDDGQELVVLLMEDTILLDTDEMEIFCEDLKALEEGAPLEIKGLLTLGGMVEAEKVVAPAAVEEEPPVEEEGDPEA